MNVTELYRELKMTKDEFFTLVQELGFDIGERAIKLDDTVAVKIIAAIKEYRKKSEKKSIFGEEKKEETEEKKEGGEPIKLPDKITVKNFANLLGKRVPDLIAILMQSGIMATINETLDYETAAIISEDLGYVPELSLEGEVDTSEQDRSNLVAEVKDKEKKEDMKDRAPVVVIMGHVDHGKTKLLDAIRNTNVIDTEAGGITQSIGAYQVVKNGRAVTFIDTPGHEAFTAMRSRGARVADIAILVIAADDGIKPQTIESVHILQEAGLPFVVAINKIDKPEADIDRVKKELAEINLAPEDYGGKTITVPISAKENKNIDELLDTVLLVADMDRENIMANPEGETVCTVIESNVDKHMGPVATMLVQNGTLKIGDIVLIGNVPGRIRSLKDWTGKSLKEAGPSVPVQVLGLKKAPVVGDILQVVTDKKVLKQAGKAYDSFAFLKKQIKGDEEGKKKLYIVLRADNLGSLEAIVQSLHDIRHEEVGIDIVQKGLGAITENDIAMARAADAIVLGFNSNPTSGAEKFARDEKIEIKTFDVIYHLIDYAKEELQKLLKKEVSFEKIGSLKVLAVFKKEATYVIAGGRVEDGKMRNNAPVKIVRGGKMIGEGVITELQKEKKRTSEVTKGSECGMRIDGDTDIQEGDSIEAHKEVETERTL
ncbi:MAG: translation initiation factor IF-2 [Candidatus Kerfeldbacteria bacterium]